MKKKQLSLFIWAAAMFGMTPVFAASNLGSRGGAVVDLSGGPDSRADVVGTTEYGKYQTKSTKKVYSIKDDSDLYYVSKSRREIYKDYKGCIYEDCEPGGKSAERVTPQSVRAETSRRESGKKYYLANPFFQPQQGRVGNVTNLAYNLNSYDMSDYAGIGKAKWDYKQIAIKEDLSFGISDNFAVVGSARYSNAKYSIIDVSDNKYKNSDSGIDLWGLGFMWKFVNNTEWITHMEAYWQGSDVFNSFVAGARGGYKVGNSTIYGLAQVWSINLDNDIYGDGIMSSGGQTLIALDVDAKNSMYIEGGIGLFSVLAPDWTLNLEATIGDYSWHVQANIRSAIGWQPAQSFALQLYAKTSIYDSANGKDDIGIYQGATNPLSHIGNTSLSKYNDTSVGIQAILYF